MVLFGIDVSHYQVGLDLSRVAAEGLQFVIAKVSEGAALSDPTWPAFRDGARQHGLDLGGYHYITAEPPSQQAARCRATLGELSIPVALDWETGSGSWANFVAVLDAFRSAGMRVFLAYCPQWYWAQHGSPDMHATGLPLWSSRYVPGGPATPERLYGQVQPQQWTGYGGLATALLQYTDRASVAGTTTDCSAFLGTQEQLHTLFTGAPPNPGHQEPVEPITLHTAADGRFRTTVMAEGAAASLVVARIFLTTGSAWGDTTWTITALDSGGGVLSTATTITADRHTDYRELPANCRMVTLEGRITPGAVPAAALVIQYR